MRYKSSKFYLDLQDSLGQTNLNKSLLMMLHIRLKEIYRYYNISYEQLTSEIIELLEKQNPINIIVPSFTYSFTKTKKFNTDKSKSEVGKFSEIFRINHSKFRTPDPIFSLCHKKKIKNEYDNIDNYSAFTDNSIWKYLYENNVTIINIGLKHLIISLVHYIEFICKVPYRKIIKIQGNVVTNNIENKINYHFYARNYDFGLGLDWKKIESDLFSNNLLKTCNNKILKFQWITSSDLSKFILERVKKNPYYLVKKIK